MATGALPGYFDGDEAATGLGLIKTLKIGRHETVGGAPFGIIADALVSVTLDGTKRTGPVDDGAFHIWTV